MQPTLENFYRHVKSALSPITEIPADQEAIIGNEIRRLDDIRSKTSIAALGALALGIVFWPPYNLGTLACAGAYIGYEAQKVARNWQGIYLDGDKRTQAKASREGFFNLLTADTVLAKRGLPYLISDTKVVEWQQSIPPAVAAQA